MPLRKFRSIEEMNRADLSRCRARVEKGIDAEYLAGLRRLWATSGRLSAFEFPRGVRKYRSIEEAQADKESLLREHVRNRHRLRFRSEEAL